MSKVFRSMFHVRDGLYVEKRISSGCSGYSDEELINHFYNIFIHVTELETAREIINGEVTSVSRTKIIHTYEINAFAFASIMATLSVRGETSESYQEALDYLKANEDIE